MKTYQQRINNIIGQLEGVKKMIDGESNACDVITQSKAAKKALHSFLAVYMQENFCDCMQSYKTKAERHEAIKKMFNDLIN